MAIGVPILKHFRVFFAEKIEKCLHCKNFSFFFFFWQKIKEYLCTTHLEI